MLYLVRHGQTNDNLPPKKAQGLSDTPLNPTGIAQANQLAAEIDGLWIEKVVTSPLARAVETAKIVANAVALEPVLEPRLVEGDRGHWEGLFFKDISEQEPDLYASWRRSDVDFCFPGGESLRQHRERSLAAIREIAARPETSLVVSHRGTIRFILLELRGWPTGRFHEVQVPNAEPIEITEDERARLANGYL